MSGCRVLFVEGSDVTRLDGDNGGRDAVELAARHYIPRFNLHSPHLPRLLPTVDISILRDRITSSVARCGSPTLALHHVQH